MRTICFNMEKLINQSRQKLLTKKTSSLLQEPKTYKSMESGQGNGLKYALASMQGWRKTMEDFHSTKIGLSDQLTDWSYFAVFDGYYGDTVANYCCENLLKSFLTYELNRNVESSIYRGFLEIDEELKNIPEIMKKQSGTTVTLALVSSEKIYIVNLGDSRTILYGENSGVFATKDHKPFMPDEKNRIERAGGFVKNGRVNGSISVSRTLGDFEYKSDENIKANEQQISSEPEIFVFDRHKGDKFVILASDGVWRGFKTSELCSFVELELSANTDLKEICTKVIDTSFSRVVKSFWYSWCGTYQYFRGDEITETHFLQKKKFGSIFQIISDSISNLSKTVLGYNTPKSDYKSS